MIDEPSDPDGIRLLEQAIQRGGLEEAATRLLGRRCEEILDVTMGRVSGFRTETTLGIFYVGAQVRTDKGVRRVQCALKVLQPPPQPCTLPMHDRPGEWRRESLAFASGVLPVAGPIRVPRFLGVTRMTRPLLGLWLEWITDTSEEFWTLERYRAVAERLGKLQAGAAALAGVRWASRDVLPRMALRWKTSGYRAGAGVRSLKHFVQALEPLEEQMIPLLREARKWPQILCHFDVSRVNFSLEGRRPILLDWGFAGRGPLGADVGIWLASDLGWGAARPELSAELGPTLLDGYLRGLGRAGAGEARAQVLAAVRLGALVRIGGSLARLVGSLVKKELPRDELKRRRERLDRVFEPLVAFTRSLEPGQKPASRRRPKTT